MYSLLKNVITATSFAIILIGCGASEQQGKIDELSSDLKDVKNKLNKSMSKAATLGHVLILNRSIDRLERELQSLQSGNATLRPAFLKKLVNAIEHQTLDLNESLKENGGNNQNLKLHVTELMGLWNKIKRDTLSLTNLNYDVKEALSWKEETFIQVKFIQRSYEKIIERFVEEEIFNKQLYQYQRQFWLLERISYNLESIFEKDSNPITVEDFFMDIHTLKFYVEGQLEGDNQLNIQKATSKELREELQEILKEVTVLEASVSPFINKSPQYYKFRNNIDDLLVSYNRMLLRLKEMARELGRT